ncbi:MAG: hypothetical protein ABSE73_15430, partial [Planctomycetota bacterium]
PFSGWHASRAPNRFQIRPGSDGMLAIGVSRLLLERRTVDEDFIAQHPEVPIKLVVQDINQGLGNNFAEAAFHGRGKYYRPVCGDNVEPQEALVKVFRRVGEADIILTYHEAAVSRGLARGAISRLFTALVNFLSGYKIRYYNGLPVARRYDVLRWHSNCHGFGFQADLITRLLDLGASYIEVPVSPHERRQGSSKALTLKNLCSVAHTLLEIFIRRAARIMYPQQFKAMRAQWGKAGGGTTASSNVAKS